MEQIDRRSPRLSLKQRTIIVRKLIDLAVKKIFSINFLLVLASLTSLSGCELGRYEPGDSVIRGLLNGEKWEAPARGNSESHADTISMSGTFDKNEINSEDISFRNIPFKEGEYRLLPSISANSPGATFYTVVGGDALNDAFYLSDDTANVVEVTGIDRKYNIISGSFQLDFIRDPDEKNENNNSTEWLPDTLRFRNGYFHVRIKD